MPVEFHQTPGRSRFGASSALFDQPLHPGELQATAMALHEFLPGPMLAPELDTYELDLLDEEQAESGGQGYYSGSGGASPTSSSGVTALGLGSGTAAGGRKPSKGKGSRGPRPRLFKKGTCQADGCEADLTPLPFYNQRNHICMEHKKAETFTKLGETVRFCQRCGVSHPLGDFEGLKRSCRKQLAKHNSRRRKQGASPTATSSGSPASPVDSGACATSAPALFPTAPSHVVDLFASDLQADLHLAAAVAPAGDAAGSLELGAAALGSGSLPAAAGTAAALPPLLPPPPPPTIEEDPLDEPWWHDLLAGADGSTEQLPLAVAAPQQQQHAAPTAAFSHERVCGACDERVCGATCGTCCPCCGGGAATSSIGAAAAPCEPAHSSSCRAAACGAGLAAAAAGVGDGDDWRRAGVGGRGAAGAGAARAGSSRAAAVAAGAAAAAAVPAAVPCTAAAFRPQDGPVGCGGSLLKLPSQQHAQQQQQAQQQSFTAQQEGKLGLSALAAVLVVALELFQLQLSQALTHVAVLPSRGAPLVAVAV